MIDRTIDRHEAIVEVVTSLKNLPFTLFLFPLSATVRRREPPALLGRLARFDNSGSQTARLCGFRNLTPPPLSRTRPLRDRGRGGPETLLPLSGGRLGPLKGEGQTAQRAG